MINSEPALHGKKVSDVFLEYVDPILTTLKAERPNTSFGEQDEILQVPWMVWNAVVLLETKPSTTDYVKMIEQMLIGQPPMMRSLFEFWIQRKRTQFAKYKYMIGEYRSYRRADGKIVLHAEARAVSSELINGMATKFH